MFVDKNSHQKGELTNDDASLFVSTLNTNTSESFIAKIDVKTQTFKLLTDREGNSDNQLDFNLFDIKYNRVVTLSLRN